MEKIFDRALPTAVNLARKAGKLQMKYLEGPHSVVYKGKIDIVTEVDKKCEALIFEGINKKFPNHDVLAEEGIAKRKKSEFRWIVDPLDGTVNYAHKFPFFAVSIALEYRDELVLGVIYDPVREELFSACKNKGTYLNGRRVKVSSSKSLGESLLATGFAYNIQEKGKPDNLNNFAKFIKVALALRRPGSAAIDMAYVACGRIDGFWELFLKPWDMAAGVVLIREAGGKVTSFDGGAYNLYGSEILVSNGIIHKEMISVLKV